MSDCEHNHITIDPSYSPHTHTHIKRDHERERGELSLKFFMAGETEKALFRTLHVWLG